MAIEAPSSIRAAAADQREAARQTAHLYFAECAQARRDQRVDEAKESAAARPTPAERAAEAPPPRRRAASTAVMLDVLT